MANIRKRVTKGGKVRWDMQVYMGRDPATGRLKFVTRSFTREGDAKKEATRLQRMKDGGLSVQPSKETLGKYLERWLEAKAKEVRASTIYGYRSHMNTAVLKPRKGTPPLGVIRLDRLTTASFDALYTHLWEMEGLSPRSIRYTHTVLRQALKDAVRQGLLARNPTDHVKLPKRKHGEAEGEERKIRAMSEEEAGKFLGAAQEDRYHALWLLLLMGGLRPSEAFALSWKDVDFERSRIHIHRSLTRNGVKGWKVQPTKTPKSNRTLPLPGSVMRAVREWKVAQAKERLLLGSEYENHGFVFTTEFGSPLDGGNLLSRNFRQVMSRVGLGHWEEAPKKPKGQPGPGKKPRFIPAFRVYDLRHTCATLLLKRGVNPKIVQERLGHASITLTLDTYSHVLPDMQGVAVEEMEGMFGT